MKNEYVNVGPESRKLIREIIHPEWRVDEMVKINVRHGLKTSADPVEDDGDDLWFLSGGGFEKEFVPSIIQ